MKVKLEAMKDVIFSTGYYESDNRCINKGDIIEAKFSQFGVSLLFGDCWSFDYAYQDIRECFKVYGQ